MSIRKFGTGIKLLWVHRVLGLKSPVALMLLSFIFNRIVNLRNVKHIPNFNFFSLHMLMFLKRACQLCFAVRNKKLTYWWQWCVCYGVTATVDVTTDEVVVPVRRNQVKA